VGSALARRLGWSFYDGDDFHPSSNITKMASGVPLSDADRGPWLVRLRELLVRHDREERNVVLACSALKQTFRSRLQEGLRDLRWIYLHAELELIRRRLEERKGHFMPAALIDSQFDALEEPENALIVDANQPLDQIVEGIVAGLGG